MSTYIANLLVFPYVSRVFGVERMGTIGFADNVVNFFSLFALLGIPTVGVREIAACGNDREKRSRVFSSITLILLLSTAVVITAYEIAIFSVPRFAENRRLLLTGSFILLSSSFLFDWLFQGLENFRFVAIRTIIVKILYVASVFLFVRNADDFLTFYNLTAAMFVVNAGVNMLHARKFVDFSFRRISLRRYAVPVLSLGLYRLMVSMYTTFNVVFIGLVCSDTQVGFYYTSTKVFNIILGVLTSYTMVMLPRMSSLLAENRMDEFVSNIRNSFLIVFSVALPLIAGSEILAPQIIRVLSGNGFEGAVAPMRIIMPLILVVGIAQICVIQVLMPLKEDRTITVAAAFGAAGALTANFLLVRNHGAVGSAVVLLVSELISDSICLGYACRRKLIRFPLKDLFRYLLGSIPYAAVCLLCAEFIPGPMMALSVAFALCLSYFVIYNRKMLKK